MSFNIKTPEFRVSWPAVFTPTTIEGSEPKYRITMLFDKDTDISSLEKVIQETIDERWPDPKKRPALRLPFRDGDVEKPEMPGYQNTLFANASNKQKPALVDQNVQQITDESVFYPGCYARALIRVFAYPKEGVKSVSNGIAFSIQAIQKTREGDPFSSGRVVAENIFDVISSDMGADERANYESMLE